MFIGKIIASRLKVINDIKCDGFIDVSDMLNVRGNAFFRKNVEIDGNLDISDGLNVDGDVSFNSILNVNGDVLLNSKVDNQKIYM